MCVSYTRCLAACVALIISISFTQAGFAQTGFVQTKPTAEILIADAKSQPESLTIAPGGVLIVGSASSPFVYKA